MSNDDYPEPGGDRPTATDVIEDIETWDFGFALGWSEGRVKEAWFNTGLSPGLAYTYMWLGLGFALFMILVRIAVLLLAPFWFAFRKVTNP